MRKVLIILSVLLSFGWTFAVTRAQEALTQTFTAADGSFSFMYPADWQVRDTGFGKTLVSVPAASLEGEIDYLNFPGALKDNMRQLLTSKGGAAASSTEISDLQINGHPAVQAESLTGTAIYLLAVDMGSDMLFFDYVLGSPDSVKQAEPTLLAIAASLQAPPGSGGSAAEPTTAPDSGGQAEALTQTYTSTGLFTLMYPDGWTSEAREDGSVLLNNPDKSVYIIAGYQPLGQTAREHMQGNGVPDSDINEFEVDGRTAASGMRPDNIFVASVDYPNDQDFWMTVGGQPDAVHAVVPTALAILNSFKLMDTSGGIPLTKSVTAGEGAAAITVMLPNNWDAIVVPAKQEAHLALLESFPNHIGGDIVYPVAARAGGASTAEAIITQATSNYAGTVTAFELDGREAARFDGAKKSDPSTAEFYVIVRVEGGDYVLFSCYGPVDAMKQEEATILAMAAAVTAVNAAPTASTPVETQAVIQRPTVVNGVSTIIFSAWPDLYSVSPDGSNLRQITHQQLNALRPALSPDGTMLAYIAGTSNTSSEVSDVFVVPVSGGEPRKLSSQSSLGPGPVVWSADGTSLLFLANREGGIYQTLYRVNPDGSDEQPVTFDGVNVFDEYNLDVSPVDGRVLFIGSDGSGNTALMFSNPDGTGLTRGPDVNLRFEGGLVKWSPDGQSLLVDDTQSLAVVDVNSGGSKTILDETSGLLIYGIAWSPDGTQIAFTGFKPSDGQKRLYTINADGSNMQSIDTGNQFLSTDEITWGLVAGGGSSGTAPTEAPAEAPTAAPTNGEAPAAAACTVTARSTANLRGGPGTTFAKTGSLASGVTQSVTGQAQGANGKVWYQLDGGSWVRSDLVNADGDCASVPTVSP